ncbi:RIP metalloprotease RseP [Enterococcus sp. HY326]|uniref:RIP metalloprotease RseP n=1 Tax=Enterococcus sp. HY326 TaxID=2971265 RepID=UPI0022403658|nr:RIP metalloprotease RseP [Enterococcus sp. HY326]
MRTVITFIIVFGVIVLVHEFGHFFFAKRSGILVREFAIGMGPKIWGYRDKTGTTYTLRLLPIGGYVRMAGNGEEEVEMTPGMPISVELDQHNKVVKINTSKKVQLTHGIPLELTEHDLVDALTISGYVNGDESEVVTYKVDHDATIIEPDGIEIRIAPRDVQFQSAKLWQRLLTNFAGPMNNFILAVILFIVVAFMRGGVYDSNSTTLGDIQADSVAASAGLQSGDTVLSVDGEAVTTWSEMQTDIQASPDEEISLEVERAGEELTINLTPAATVSGDETYGMIGVSPALIETSVFDKIASGFSATIANSLNIFQALGRLVTNFSLNQLGGPVAIFQMSSEAANSGLITVISFMAMLSVNLGIMNLLPIPALDGGKIVLNLIEGIRGKPISPEKEGILTLIGFGCLMLLMIFVTWNDIQRFLF